MASWVDLNSIHNPAPGRRPPAAWGDGVVENLGLLRSIEAAEVLAGSTTTSASFTDLASVGPAVTVDTGTTALVLLSATFFNNTTSAFAMMSFTVSGATVIAASDDNALYQQESAGGAAQTQAGTFILLTTLTPGVNTFTAKYKATSGTATFVRRRIAVIPLF